MAIHVNYSHKCPKCGLEYIAYKEGIKCPKCGAEPNEVFDIVGEAISSYWYNIDVGSMPIFGIADFYVYHIQRTITKFLRKLVGVTMPEEAKKVLMAHIVRMRFDQFNELKEHMKELTAYLVDRLIEVVYENGEPNPIWLNPKKIDKAW